MVGAGGLEDDAMQGRLSEPCQQGSDAVLAPDGGVKSKVTQYFRKIACGMLRCE